MKDLSSSVFIVPECQLFFRPISGSNQAFPSSLVKNGYLRAADVEIELLM